MKREESVAPAWNRTPDHQSHSLVFTATMLTINKRPTNTKIVNISEIRGKKTPQLRSDIKVRDLCAEKAKGNPKTCHEGPEGRYSSTLLLISALDRGGGGAQRHAPAALPPGKETRYPLYRRLEGRGQGRSGWVRKISHPTGFDARTVHPVASPYTDCAKKN
jgi:hypothetical protein